MEISTTIDLLRHGEPVGGRRYRGQTDDPLSDKGWRQMRDAVGDHCPWDVVVTSSLRRCAEFARELAERHSLPLATDERLMEIGFGEWEGRTAGELMQQDPEILARFYNDPVANRPAGAESLTDFGDRIVAAWHDTLRHYSGKHLLMIGHAGMMRMIMRHVLGMPLDRMFRLQVPNAGITRIQVDGQGERAFPCLLFHAGTL